VTNSIWFLSQMDEIILLEDGSIVEMGSYDELKENSPRFVTFLNKYAEAQESHDKEECLNQKYLHRILICLFYCDMAIN
jgi:ABC-type multidrug transport system ATPase subunit